MSRNPKGNNQVKKTSTKPTVGNAPHEQRANNKMTVSIDDLAIIEGMTPTQDRFLDDYDAGDYAAYLLYGSAGTGKTTLGLYGALEDVLGPNGKYRKIIIVRSPREVVSLGYLPGDVDSKLEVYEAPYHDICRTLFPKISNAYEKLKTSGVISFVPTSFIRGVTFDNSIIIFDEFQSATWHELSSVATRFGKDCKIVFCGDYAQNDLVSKRNEESGFEKLVGVMKNTKMCGMYQFTRDDIVRSGFTKNFIIAADDWDIGIR